MLLQKAMVNAMSDLTVKTTPDSVVTSSRKTAVQTETKTISDAGANASSRQSSAPDISNYVTSPKGVVDPTSGVFVLQYRDGATGEVKMQYPSAKAVDAYKRGGEGTSAEQVTASVPQTGSGETAGVGVETPSVSTTTSTAAATSSTPASAPSSGETSSGTGTGSTSSVDV